MKINVDLGRVCVGLFHEKTVSPIAVILIPKKTQPMLHFCIMKCNFFNSFAKGTGRAKGYLSKKADGW